MLITLAILFRSKWSPGLIDSLSMGGRTPTLPALARVTVPI
jgi:hypothetical protein